MPYVKIWIHAVWATKNRKKQLIKEVRQSFFEHIHQNALAKGILMDCVNGYLEHVHCLFRLKNDQTISKTMQLIKGEASFWFNKNYPLREKLSWQDEYFAVSVSESQVDKVRKYIHRQEAHHRQVSFQQEYDNIIKNFGFQVFKD